MSLVYCERSGGVKSFGSVTINAAPMPRLVGLNAANPPSTFTFTAATAAAQAPATFNMCTCR